MIERMFPESVSNILDYDTVKISARKYVEELFNSVCEQFSSNLVLQLMDNEHLSEVTKRVTGNEHMSLNDFLDYINTDSVYHECEFYNALMTAFPEGVTYESFKEEQKYPNSGLIYTGSFIDIKVDEERTIIGENGLSPVETWLSTVVDKIQLSVYIHITDLISTAEIEPMFPNAYPYNEEEVYCTNDPDWALETYKTEDGTVFDNSGKPLPVIPIPQPDPKPEPPTPIEPTEDFAGQGITGTLRVWGDSATTGTSFDDYSYGNTVDSKLSSYNSTETSSEPIDTSVMLGGVMSED